MTNRNVCRALTVAALACGVSAMPLVARAHDHDPYIAKTSPKAPKAVKATKATHEHHDSDDNKNVTLVGCFIRGTDHDGDHVRYLLGDVTPGPATTVADQNCIATGQVIRIKHADDVGLDHMTSGRWIEAYGELEKSGDGDADDMQKFEVKSFREVPQTPRVAVMMIPAPAPPPVAYETPAPEPRVETPAPEPVATAGTETPKKLPHTASPLPLIAMLGLFALSGGLVLGLVDRRRAEQRG